MYKQKIKSFFLFIIFCPFFLIVKAESIYIYQNVSLFTYKYDIDNCTFDYGDYSLNVDSIQGIAENANSELIGIQYSANKLNIGFYKRDFASSYNQTVLTCRLPIDRPYEKLIDLCAIGIDTVCFIAGYTDTSSAIYYYDIKRCNLIRTIVLPQKLLLDGDLIFFNTRFYCTANYKLYEIELEPVVTINQLTGYISDHPFGLARACHNDSAFLYIFDENTTYYKYDISSGILSAERCQTLNPYATHDAANYYPEEGYFNINNGQDIIHCTSTFRDTLRTGNPTTRWSTGQTGSQIIVSSPGKYWAEINNGCSIFRDTIEIKIVNALAGFLGDDIYTCENQPVTVGKYIPNATYQWYNGNTEPIIIINGFGGNYWVKVSLDNCIFYDTIQIFGKPIPELPALQPKYFLCNNTPLIIDARTPGNTGSLYNWYSTKNGFTLNSPTLNIYQDDTITLFINKNGCQNSYQFRTFGYIDTFLGPDRFFCRAPLSETLEGFHRLFSESLPANASFRWSTGDTTVNIVPPGSGKYWLDVFANGCKYSDTIILNDMGSILGNDIPICSNRDIQINAKSINNATYYWSNGVSGINVNSITVNQPGTYSVIINPDNRCLFYDTIKIYLDNSIAVNLGNDVVICNNDSLTLNAFTSNARYLWNTGDTASRIKVFTSGIYWVRVFIDSCMGTDTINIQKVILNKVDLGRDTTLCPGQILALNATTPNATYAWNTGSTNPTLSVASPGIYWVKVKVAGCETLDTIVISYFSTPGINIGRDTILCSGQTLTLDATTPNASYSWNTSENTPSIIVSNNGQYIVYVTTNNCTVSDTINVYFISPTVFIGNDTTICDNSTMTLNASATGAQQYLWSTNETTSFINVHSAGIYWVRITIGGCTKYDSITIQTISAPVVQLGNDTSLCIGDTIILEANTLGATYLWNTNETTSSITVDKTGNYIVKASKNNCSTYDTIQIIFNSIPQFNLGPDTQYCKNEKVILNTFLTNGSFLWSSGQSTPYTQAIDSGLYWVKVSINNCASSDSILIDFINCEGCRLYVPNAFTPNHDGLNDILAPIGSCDYTQFSFKIFNRWGELVFESNDLGQGWDGTYKNVNALMDSYSWVLEYEDKKNAFLFKGIIILFR